MSPRESPEDKRAAILAAAFSRFTHYGYRRTVIDDIAREAGISKGTVYLYFESKEAIFRALVQQVLDRALEGVAAARRAEGPIAERIYRMLDAKAGHLFEVVRGSAHADELIDSSKNQVCADVVEKVDRRFRRLLGDAIAEAEERGEIRPGRMGLTPVAVADLLAAASHGIESTGSTPPSPAQFRRKLHDLVRIMMAGLGAAAA